MTTAMLDYYTRAHTARGFVSFMHSNLAALPRVYIVQGPPCRLKTRFMRDIAARWASPGHTIEYVHSVLDPEQLEAILVPSAGFGLVESDVPVDLPADRLTHIEMGRALDDAAIAAQQDALQTAQRDKQSALEDAYRLFVEALAVHDQWERIYIDNMDFTAADQLAQQLTADICGSYKGQGEGHVVHRFLGAATPAGARDFVPILTQGIGRRIFIKGRPGTGKSTLLRKVITQAQPRGLDLEVYHCAFDPNSLDMLIIRQLDIAVFDSTAPHEYFPSRPGDELLDVYQRLVRPGADELHKVDLHAISTQYRTLMDAATAALARARAAQDQTQAIYAAAIDALLLHSAARQAHM